MKLNRLDSHYQSTKLRKSSVCPQEGEHTEVFKVDLAKCVEFLKERTKCGDIVDSRVWSLFTGLSLGLGK